MTNKIDPYQLERDIRDYLARMRWVAKSSQLSQNQKYRIAIYELALEKLLEQKAGKQ